MPQYRLEVWRDERLWCRIEADAAHAREAVADLAARLPSAEGYRLALSVADAERRLLRAEDGRIEVLAREPLWRPMPLEALERPAERRGGGRYAGCRLA